MERGYAKQVRDMSRAELDAHVAALRQSTAPIVADEMERRVASAALVGAEPKMELLLGEGGEGDSRAALLELHCGVLRDAAEYTPELLLPLPTVLGVETVHLLTPFPLVVEAPALAPIPPCRELLCRILDRAGTASPSELLSLIHI